MIKVERLTKKYAGVTAISNLSFEVAKGEIVGFLGPNGAGKSTTLRVLIGQRQPTAGQVRVAGYDVVRQWALVKPLFGYVPDRENHFEEFTGRKNLEIFAGLYRVPASRIDECLHLVELTDAADVKVKGYSLGMRRKLLMARALLHQPPVLYLDEPTANLDVHSAEVMHRILRQLVAQGRTVLMTTHNMPEVEEVCDRVAILCRGKLVALNSPLALRRQHHHRKVEVILLDGTRRMFDMDDKEERRVLAGHFAGGEVASAQTREFDFHQAFLKLTGTEFT